VEDERNALTKRAYRLADQTGGNEP
jgi:hypothetical protein